ncbi:unnamed protein product [Diatraea saccharalis]|uniref:Superoxide dismutase [Cu-Zn] n=1 Tax=Diatraea saccharalis TaxID=40085 RepID=A0A9N9R023_9NEOP|nr:unnamed protein product [Diatraea saccharalis]
MGVGLFVLISLSFTLISAQQLQRTAVAHFSSENGIVRGTVLFTETNEGIRVTGRITGMPPGSYGFHVHELGDLTSCDNTGAHYNPRGVNHGGPEHNVRHVGDLGNVHFVSTGSEVVSTMNTIDRLISLRGINNILGRALVLHQSPDDLGLGGHPDSLTTGNAGPRVACAVIGMHAPVEAWQNSSMRVGPSVLLLLGIAFMRFFN